MGERKANEWLNRRKEGRNQYIKEKKKEKERKNGIQEETVWWNQTNRKLSFLSLKFPNSK